MAELMATEAEVKKDVKGLLRDMGCFVSDTSQGYRPGGKRHGTTRITKGVPDLHFQHPRHGTGWLEIKGSDTPVSQDQLAWHRRERAAGGRCVYVRSAADARWALWAWGFPLVPDACWQGPSEELLEQMSAAELVRLGDGPGGSRGGHGPRPPARAGVHTSADARAGGA